MQKDQAPSKKSIEVSLRDKTVRVGWYAGSTDESIAKAVRAALGLAEGMSFLLRDAEGDVVAISDSLPAGLKLTAEVSGPAVTAGAAAPKELATVDAAAPAVAHVPGPKPYPFIGNLPLFMGKGGPAPMIRRLAREYGDFFHLQTPTRETFVNGDADVLQDILSRPQDFPKIVSNGNTGLSRLRRGGAVSAGLFTADDTEEMWHIAHRVLLPALGLGALKQYYGRMSEVADDLLTHLSRLHQGESFLVTDLMTRMTFEAISYTGFNTRWGCIDSPQPPPFVQAMVDVLTVSMESVANVLPDTFHPLNRHKRERANAVLLETVDKIISERRMALERGEAVPNDILQAMLTTRDRVTGKRLPDDNIRAQLITFLIAGHETTSGLLSYALHAVAKNPEVERKLIAEVDAVLGRDYSRRPTFSDIEKLDYTLRVLKETLRLHPTAPGFFRVVARDTVVGGKYAVPAGSNILTNLTVLHTNTRFWGDNPERFDPDRFLPEAIAARHPNAYHPFGIGMRSCIGFQFALIEAKMVMARLYQKFLPRLANPNYQLQDVQTLTIKPKDLHMQLLPRTEERGRGPVASMPAAEAGSQKAKAAEPAAADAAGSSAQVLILYGSNMGACQDLAQTLARQARSNGLAPTVSELDAASGALPAQGLVLIVTSTYNGNPPDNAVRFAKWLDDSTLSSDTCKGLRYAVLGCGNKQWKATFQKFPRLVYERLQALGGQPIYPLGACDADGDFEAAAESFCNGIWPVISRELGAASTSRGLAPVSPMAEAEDAPLYTIEVVNFAGTAGSAALPSRAPLSGQAFFSAVLKNEELQSKEAGRSTRHIEFALPHGTSYAAGDHLGVFPENPPQLVSAVVKRCGARLTDVVILRAAAPLDTSAEALPCGVPITVSDLLTYHVDLAGPISRKELRALARRCPCPPERTPLEALAQDPAFKQEVAEAKLGLLELLTRFASIDCDLATLLSLRPLIKPRYYSISSSPRVLAEACSITVGVHNCARQDGSILPGLCSHFLAGLQPGMSARVVIKDTKSSFRLPADAATDIILIGPGTGLAPLRGFIAERAALRQSGVAVGKTLLFFGCRQKTHDFIYEQELAGYLKSGDLAALHVAFSREPGKPKTYVQHHIRAQAAALLPLIDGGAYVYVCGDARQMAPDVSSAFVDVLKQGGLPAAQAEARLEQLKAEGRYLQDVWASS